ncbi:MAG TPA: M48 family metallopeptidase [Fredinandcohnia sp.]|nr:M48 family metallopeptidase [Fredinandcohnia sp.]
MKLRWLVLCALTTLACATVARVTQAPAAAVGRLLLPPEQEARLGAELAAEVRQREKMLDDAEVQEWIARVQNRIVGAVPADDRQFEFETQVIDDPETINAFALPGGYLFVYSGLIAAAESEAEVASVLAHEVAHVTLDHPAQQLATRLGVDTLQAILLGDRPGAIAQLGAGIAAQGYIAAYSREDEAEADRFGLSYLAAAGYDPQAMVSFFRKLERLEGEGSSAVDRFFASHPSSADRARELEAQIRALGLRGGKSSLVGGFDGIRARLAADSR